MARMDAEQVEVRRTGLVHWILVGVVSIFIGRLWLLQLVSGDVYRTHSRANSVKVRPIEAPRGIIRDRRGRVLVSNRSACDLVANREAVEDWRALGTWLVALTGEPVDRFVARAERRAGDSAFQPVVVARDLAFSQVAWFEARKEDQPALSIEVNVRRLHAHAEGAHVLGHVGEISAEELKRPEFAHHQPRDQVGKTGIERSRDALLSGTRGERHAVVNHVGRPIGSSVAVEPRRGADLFLTLDLDVQRAAETALAGRRGAAACLDVRSGAVVAIASSPTFEPNAFVGGISSVRWEQYREDALDPLRFRAVAGTYPPGSVWKTLVAAAALEQGIAAPSFAVTCAGQGVFHGQVRRCWKEGGHGTVDFMAAMSNSCNVYFYTLARDVKAEPIEALGEAVGFGQLTGIDVPGERSGILPSDAWKRRTKGERWYPGDTINLGIGQGFLSVTPVQVALLAMSIANGGDVWQPHLLARAADPMTGETLEEFRPWVMRRLDLKPATRALLVQAMERTVASGTGTRAGLTGIRVAGKTGTAQAAAGEGPKDVPRSQWHDRHRDHAWFMGFAPVEAPEVAVAVVLEHAGAHGGEVAAPVARDVLAAWFEPGEEAVGR